MQGPRSIAADANGNVYASDGKYGVVRFINVGATPKVVNTVAGVNNSDIGQHWGWFAAYRRGPEHNRFGTRAAHGAGIHDGSRYSVHPEQAKGLLFVAAGGLHGGHLDLMSSAEGGQLSDAFGVVGKGTNWPFGADASFQ